MKDKYKIQIGDVLYEYSKIHNKIFEWKILDIWFEDYIGGIKTIVKCSKGCWTQELFVADIFAMYRTREEAEQALKGGAE